MSEEELIKDLDAAQNRIAELEQSVAMYKKREEALRQSENRYRSLFETSPDSIFIADKKSNCFIAANPAASSLYGYTQGEFLRMKNTEVSAEPENTETEAGDSMTRVLSRLHRRKDGTAFPVEIACSYFTDGGREYQTAFIRDITERKQMKEDIRQSDEMYLTLFNNERAAVCIADVETLRIIDVNETLVRLYGYSRDELLGNMNLKELSAEHEESVLSIQSFNDNKETIFIPLRWHRNKDGTVFPVEIIAGIYRWRGNRLILAIVFDITERKKAEAELRNSEENFHAIFNNSIDGILLASPQGPIFSANKAACEMLGWSEEEICERGKDIVVDTYDPRLPQALKEREESRRFRGELNFKKKGGEIFPVELSSTLFVLGNGELRTSIIFRDITQRKQAENALRESEENFRTFFETMDDLILVGSPVGKIFYANSAVSKKLGYSQDELEKKHILELHPSEKRKEAEEIFSAMFKGEMDICPLPLQSKAGTLVPVETRVWFGKWNGTDCIFGLCKDLSKEQEALQKFNRLFRHNPALMALNSMPDRRFADVNDAFLNTLGYSREEVIGKDSDELGIFMYPEKQRGIAAQLRANGSIANHELQVKCKDGTILDGLFSGDIIESQGEKYFLTVMIDQSRRRQAERAIRESESKFRALFESAQDAILLLDQDIIIDCNTKALDIFACAREQIIGQTPYFFSPEFQADGRNTREEVRKKIAEAVKGQTQFFEWNFIGFDGSLHYAEVNLNPFVAANKHYLLAIARDITDRKKAEMELNMYRNQLEDMVFSRTEELTKAYELLKQENDVRRTTEVELDRRKQELEEMNTALRVILKQREEDKANLEMNVIANHKVSILPYLELLEGTKLADDQKTLLSIIKSNLSVITSTFSRKITTECLGLTANELKVVSLIREGKTSKEISGLLNVSITTVNAYRRKIRAKTGLRNEDINLRSYLQSLE